MMNRFTRTLLAAAAAVLIVVTDQSCNKNPLEQLAGITTIPNFSVIMNTGETVNVLTLYGFPAVICTFSLDDAYSQKMLSILQSLYADYSRKVKFVLIGSGDSETDIKAYWSEHDYTLPYSAQDDGTEAAKFSSKVPHLIVSDKSLNAKAEYDGSGMPTKPVLERLMENIIK